MPSTTLTRRSLLLGAAALAAGVPAAAEAATSAGAPALVRTTANRPVLRLGSSGAAVVVLQNRLRVAQHPVPVTGSFGTLTRDAVRAFQRSVELTPDGIVGRRTWAALDRVADPPMGTTARPTLRQGDHGALVAEMQRFVNVSGIGGTVVVDGRFGVRTRAAIVRIQRFHGVAADGICGSITWWLLAPGD